MNRTLAFLIFSCLVLNCSSTFAAGAETKKPFPILAKKHDIKVGEVLRFQGYTPFPATTIDLCKYAGDSNKTHLINRDQLDNKCPKRLIGVEKLPEKDDAS